MRHLPALVAVLLACSCAASSKHASLRPSPSARSSTTTTTSSCAANPIEATKQGERGYDDRVANYVSDEYRDELVSEYGRFLERIAALEDAALSEADRLSLAVMQWDCAIKKEGSRTRSRRCRRRCSACRRSG